MQYQVNIIFKTNEDYSKDFIPKTYETYQEAHSKIQQINDNFITADGLVFIPVSDIKLIKITEIEKKEV